MTSQIKMTRPLPAHRCTTSCTPPTTYRVRDRVTNVFTAAGGDVRRYVGSVVASDALTFTVQWSTGEQARYSHTHEPDTLRRATVADEREALTFNDRVARADELRRAADRHPHWPAEVLRALRGRAVDLTGRP